MTRTMRLKCLLSFPCDRANRCAYTEQLKWEKYFCFERMLKGHGIVYEMRGEEHLEAMCDKVTFRWENVELFCCLFT